MSILKVLPVLGLALAGCGGGEVNMVRGGPSGSEFPVVTGDSAPSVAVPTGSREIIGSQAITLFSTREIQLQKTKGAERTSNGAVTIADGTSIFQGSGGFSAGGIQTGNIGQLTLIPTSGSYTFAKMYSGGIVDPGNDIFYGISQGVYGAATTASSISNSASATYRGDAEGIFKDGVVIPFNAGSSQLDVNFAAKSASLRMTGFDGNGAPFDTISVVGMTINGNQFDGGNLGLISGATPVEGLGANTQSTATGAFFGTTNGAGIPAEVGGQVYARGDTGAFLGTFIAK